MELLKLLMDGMKRADRLYLEEDIKNTAQEKTWRRALKGASQISPADLTRLNRKIIEAIGRKEHPCIILAKRGKWEAAEYVANHILRKSYADGDIASISEVLRIDQDLSLLTREKRREFAKMLKEYFLALSERYNGPFPVPDWLEIERLKTDYHKFLLEYRDDPTPQNGMALVFMCKDMLQKVSGIQYLKILSNLTGVYFHLGREREAMEAMAQVLAYKPENIRQEAQRNYCLESRGLIARIKGIGYQYDIPEGKNYSPQHQANISILRMELAALEGEYSKVLKYGGLLHGLRPYLRDGVFQAVHCLEMVALMDDPQAFGNKTKTVGKFEDPACRALMGICRQILQKKKSGILEIPDSLVGKRFDWKGILTTRSQALL